MTFVAVFLFIGTALEFPVTVHALVMKCVYAVEDQILARFGVTLLAGGVVSGIVRHILHFMTGGAPFDSCFEHIVVTVYATVMSRIANAGDVRCSGIGMTVGAQLRLVFNVRAVVADLTIINSVIDMGVMVEVQLSQFGMVAFYAVGIIRKRIDVVPDIIAVECLRMA